MKLVAVRDGRQVGYVTWRRVGKPRHKLIELIRIEVDEKYQSKRIATQLFNRMLKRIKFRKLFVTTHASNIGAQIFYAKMGMVFEAELKDHYYQGEPEFVFGMYKPKSI